jgi:DNA-binding transcriptional LysR family regulator
VSFELAETNVPPFSRFKMRQFALVLKLVEIGSLHDAAAALHMSQPAATKLLQDLEQALGAPLFVRHPRGMKPTPSGSMAARHAELLFSELHKMQQGIAGLQNGITGYVNMGTIMAAVPATIAPALIVMAEKHLTVEVSLHVGTSDVLLREISAGRLDFVVGSIAGAAEVDLLTYSPLSEEMSVVVAGMANPILRRQSLALEDIHSERWILPPTGTPELRSVEDAFHAAGLPLPVNSIRMGSMSATAILLGNTSMLAVVPKSVFRHLSNSQLMGLVNVQLRASIEPYGLISANGRPLSSAASTLSELIRDAARRLAITIPD